MDFTVVAPQYRGMGLATAVKAASVLDLLDAGVTVFRTGGATENRAILASNQALGFVVDEEWVTLKPSGGGDDLTSSTRDLQPVRGAGGGSARRRCRGW